MNIKLRVLSVLCAIMQIAGGIMYFTAKQSPTFIPVFIGIGGFAGIVNFFLPRKTKTEWFMCLFAGFAGLGMIIMACRM